MILLETLNIVVRDAIVEWLGGEPQMVEIKCADFDGVAFHIHTPPSSTSTLNISIKSPAAQSLLREGGMDLLKKIYGNNVATPESGYDAQLTITHNSVSPPERVNFATKCATMKSYLYAAPVYLRMESSVNNAVLPGLVDIPLRSHKERMWVKQDSVDRLTVIFSIDFLAYNDSVLGQVFCTEFAKSLQGAPTVSYTPNKQPPPLELKGVSGLPQGDGVSYITFVVYDRHYKGPLAKLENCAFTVVSFRNYIHYHLKCCKSYLHTRMRTRVENLLKVLNRAKQQTTNVQKKTIAGKAFQRNVQ